MSQEMNETSKKKSDPTWRLSLPLINFKYANFSSHYTGRLAEAV